MNEQANKGKKKKGEKTKEKIKGKKSQELTLDHIANLPTNHLEMLSLSCNSWELATASKETSFHVEYYALI